MESWQVSTSGVALCCTQKPYAHQHPIASYKSPFIMTVWVGFCKMKQCKSLETQLCGEGAEERCNYRYEAAVLLSTTIALFNIGK